MIQAVIDITSTDLETILHWYRVYKKNHEITTDDRATATKIGAVLLSMVNNMDCHHSCTFRDDRGR